MCWGVYLAIPDGEQPADVAVELRVTAGDAFEAWPEENPWIPLVFGDDWRGWIVGHGKHCSCGCVTASRNKQTVGLTHPARNHIADVADAAGLIGLGVHWTGGQFCDEELPFDIRGSIFSHRLRVANPFSLVPDSFYWVHSRSPEHFGQ